MSEKSNNYPYFVAEFIEASEYGSLRDAILFITREELKSLRSQMQSIAVKIIMGEVEKKEEFLMKIFHPKYESGSLSLVTTDKGQKELLEGVEEEIVYLYSKRRGESEGSRLKSIIDMENPPPHELIIEYETDKSGRKYIKRIKLVPLHTETPDTKKKDEDPRGNTDRYNHTAGALSAANIAFEKAGTEEYNPNLEK